MPLDTHEALRLALGTCIVFPQPALYAPSLCCGVCARLPDALLPLLVALRLRRIACSRLQCLLVPIPMPTGLEPH